MPGRKYSAGSGYRYGFNDKENDKDVSVSGQDYGMRIYDGRLGRFLSLDPLAKKYPQYTPYSFSGNSPIWLIDKRGEEPDRNQAGTVEQAVEQWTTKLKNPSMQDILNFISSDPNAVRYIYTETKGWIDLQHYFGTQFYGKTAMDLVEPLSGNKFLQKHIFGEGANESYYSYEDLPSNQFSSEAKNFEFTITQLVPIGDGVAAEQEVTYIKSGEALINAVKENFINAKATKPENAPNWKQIPFKDHGERKRLPETSAELIGTSDKHYSSHDLTAKEKEEALKTGLYIPQSHSGAPYDLKNFAPAPSSIEKGDKRVGAPGH